MPNSKIWGINSANMVTNRHKYGQFQLFYRPLWHENLKMNKLMAILFFAQIFIFQNRRTQKLMK